MRGTLWEGTVEASDQAALDPGVSAVLDRHPDVLVVGGGVIGLATAVKLTPGVFLVYLLITGYGRGGSAGQRRALHMAVFTAALLTAAPFLVIH